MPRWLPVLALLLGLPALAWNFWMIYLKLFHRLPDVAGTAGMMGVLAGFFTIAGVPVARWLWRQGEARFLALLTLLLAGLIAIMKVMGDFGEGVYGGFVPVFTFGFVLGVPPGIAVVAMLWFEETKK